MIDLTIDGNNYADELCDKLNKAGIYSQLNDPQDAFLAGVYFGAIRGYERGINIMLAEAVQQLPNIFNDIAKSGYDMTQNWPQLYLETMIKNSFKQTV